MRTLKNQTLSTQIKRYAAAVGSVYTVEEHDALHNKIPGMDTMDLPHSILFHPVRERFEDPESRIVGLITGGVAWDRSLVEIVLPESVRGIKVVIKNNCNQSYTYKFEDNDALYLGKGDLHEREYSHMEVAVDLSPNSHADFTTTPGHCLYSNVSAVYSP